ncbi:hypothetical protein CVV65_05585 [Kyrpidia spormannii]|uniref:Uncharacterized protein n=1 Tax=Kyrpidia spormannii TaxID=2055160 RepID=A0A2K8N580_9BACL|nr:hypothetical protein [Kyrpidia spormannii]ATY84494.1 hypothetical protein CVV65_05585 [Kyrpidia spormannii]
MRWAEVREMFPNQWIAVIPIGAYAKHGKEFVDEVAILDFHPEQHGDEPIIQSGRVKVWFTYHTSQKHIVFEAGTLPSDAVREYTMLDFITETIQARVYLEQGIPADEIMDMLHLSEKELDEAKRWLCEDVRKGETIPVKVEVAERMLKEGLNILDISEITDLPLELVEAIRDGGWKDRCEEFLERMFARRL